jgi:hypothetical protein
MEEGEPVHQHSRRGFPARTLGAAWTGATMLERSPLRAAQARAHCPRGQPILWVSTCWPAREELYDVTRKISALAIAPNIGMNE